MENSRHTNWQVKCRIHPQCFPLLSWIEFSPDLLHGLNHLASIKLTCADIEDLRTAGHTVLGQQLLEAGSPAVNGTSTNFYLGPFLYDLGPLRTLG